MIQASILLVDDEYSLLELLQTVLHKEGFTSIDTAQTGEAALDACALKKYDLIVLDVMLPDGSQCDGSHRPICNRYCD